jgi:hypothetical protein
MKNVYMTPLNYTNFAGDKKSTKLHFHLTPREFADWMIDHKAEADLLNESFASMSERMQEDPEGQLTEAQKLSMLRLVRILCEISYGKPSDDGEVFDKTELKQFIHSAKYDAFRLFLFQNPKEMQTFMDTILNEEVVAEFAKNVQAMEQANQNEEAPAQQPKLQAVESKDPTQMSREELLEAMRNKNQ